ncbi:bacteriocin [Breoghania sp. L-A4]|uniref:bacteriocin n=1 Tax=Breoghania sp. L-A4 TaxID=2304600 RepID=UPI000E35CF70|nr:bacteriocin [Breoghania sp. L-A4]AXS42654.1 bacteriocin [Breoghania sp. L-A4]
MFKTFAVVGICALALAGCQTDSQGDRALAGAGIGAAAGAVTGAAIGGTPGAAAGGAIAGAAGGAIIGAATTPKNCWARDRYGRSYRVACR